MTQVLSLFRGLITTPEPVLTMAGLLRATADDWDLEPETLLAKTMVSAITQPRQDFMWRARQVYDGNGKPKFSYPRIARFLGLKDHTTVIHGVKAHARRVMAKQEAKAA